jgi:hypothetical protein
MTTRLMMKKIVLLPVLLLIVFSTTAQLHNSWINYNKTYYKFKVGKDGLTRISQPALVAAGLGAVAAQDFQLWRNGKEVRLFTSVASGVLGATDYIEFWGLSNDGAPDTDLYRDPDYQLDSKYSLFSDTAVYFLTTNTTSPNLRYTTGTSLSSGSASPDPYFMRRYEIHYKDLQNRGYAAIVGEYVYSSSFDSGEGWTSGDAFPCCDLSRDLDRMNVYQTGPPNSVSFSIGAVGNALNARNLRVKFYNNIILNEPMPYFNYLKTTVNNLPLTLLQSPTNLPVAINGTSTNPNDRIVVSDFSVTYPATFNFNNEKSFYFELQPSAQNNYLLINNFNYGTTAPILLDLTNGTRYVCDITSNPGRVKIVLPASSAPVRKYVLLNQEAGSVTAIPSLTTRNFINYALAANQGDYLIVTSPTMYNNGSGINYIEQYRAYRSSITGGNFNAKVISIDEITDQYAFGIKKHPAAVRDFARHADAVFTNKPKYMFIIGRGMAYPDYKTNENNPVSDQLDIVPTFGWPASDNLLVCHPGTFVPLVPVGRLAAINGNEVGVYLNKIKEYEQAQQSSSQTVTDKAWMKNVMHVIGGKDSAENASFRSYMNSYKAIVEDTLFGGKVETFAKASVAAVQQAQSQRIDQLFQEGISLIGYFGHSSANLLEFNLSSPEVYNNPGKYPFFNVSGCSAGNFFVFNPLRLNGDLTLSEKYVLSPSRGSIGFLASTHLGIPPFLNFYNLELYNRFSKSQYGNTIGNQMKGVLTALGSNPASLDYYTRIHLEELTLHGDPALQINNFAKPDYVVEDQLVKISPSIISVADNSFDISVKMMNIGRAAGDSIRVLIRRRLPNDSIKVLYNGKIPGIAYMDSINLSVPINPLTDKGGNRLLVDLDVDNVVNELSETNNTLVKDFQIFEDELRPVYPYNYSIVNQQNLTFVGSTANPLNGQRQYVMEIDTTENFNSAFKKAYNVSGTGGVIQFTPTGLTFTDSTVYYWRTSMTPLNPGSNVIWNTSSFIYLANSSTGFNQSHYFQYKKNSYSQMTIDNDRRFRFQEVPRSLIIRNGIYPFYSFDKINLNLDFDQIEFWGCVFTNIQVYVFDSTTLQSWDNVNVGPNGRFGSWPVCNAPRKFFEFPYNNPTYRARLMRFLEDSIPAGMYVAIKNLTPTFSTNFINEWKNDTLTLGSGKSLYHTFKNIGFNKIDSFYTHRPFIYFYRKGVSSFTPVEQMGDQIDSYLDVAIPLQTRYQNGTMTSPAFGPAQSWSSLKWAGSTTDPTPTDVTKLELYGVRNDGSSTFLRTIYPARDTSLSFVNAAEYPYLRLKMLASDTIYASPEQLRYWRLLASYVPEGAINPNLAYKMRDTVEQGEKIDFAIAFKNISPVPFDSLLKVKFYITDRNNFQNIIPVQPRKALAVGDTLMVNYTIDTRNLPGVNTLGIVFNPDNHQPEQYQYNNVLLKNFVVREDLYNPLLDVTFDGVHILNRDIVSSKPNILIKLKDESRFLALADTSLLRVQVRFPDNTLRTYRFNDSMRFTPSVPGTGGVISDNTAKIDFMPYFPQDGEYELFVTGKDALGNKAGDMEYRVNFSVINKPMISNMLNYPNPFTTSTAFVFTVTGSEVPQNIRIQILTVTGKIVREITSAELGPIRIGRNITEFKWDGTDMYGQKLANGVYLYRVLTNLNGKSLEQYKSRDDRTDKYFNKGYGKMYLMR